MNDLPPGIVYLAQRLPRLVLPPTVAYALVRILSSTYDTDVPLWFLTLAMVFSLPLALTIEVQYDQYRVYRDASRLGAMLPPTIPDPYPGGISGLFAATKAFKTGYPGTSDGIDNLCEKAGGYTFNRRVLFENRIITAEPEHIKAILATQFDEFEKGEEFRSVVFPLLGTGVFAVDGNLWKFHRSMTRPFFSRDRISHFDIFDRHADAAIQQLKNRFHQGHPVDFQDLVARFTLDSATEFLLGNDVKSLSGDIPYPYYVTLPESALAKQADLPAARFWNALSEAQSITSYRTRFGTHWPLVEFWHDKLKGPMKVVYGFVDPIVVEAIKHKREMEGKIEKDRDDETLLENLVNETEGKHYYS
ncbi:unnamed protein product [Cyclocybe aegerita]|uniref:Cytochrome P450 n=1 Tax=Cyclocybe aegerita TaxID=1973307 RepID=A0A8S0VZU3_CYCAE|nr:unnamed protein product [Cyclocybe aegerita]